MANHRELAQTVYAHTLGRSSASKIWRTVVVAGAMLGAPLTATAGDPPPTKEAAKPAAPAKEKAAPATPPTKDAKAGDAKAGDAKAGAAMPVSSTVSEPPVDKAAEAKKAKEVVKTLEAEMKDLDKKIAATNKELKGAKEQPAKDAATTKLADQKKQKDELKAKITQAKADAKKADEAAKAEARAKHPPRPRVQESRPVGRGFILS